MDRALLRCVLWSAGVKACQIRTGNGWVGKAGATLGRSLDSVGTNMLGEQDPEHLKS